MHRDTPPCANLPRHNIAQAQTDNFGRYTGVDGHTLILEEATLSNNFAGRWGLDKLSYIA